MKPNPGDQLTRALITLAAQGQRPRCGDPETHWLWLSEAAGERAIAAEWCAGCPVLRACGDAAEYRGEQFGVWGGLDRTGIKQPRRSPR